MTLVTELVCSFHSSPVKYVACKAVPVYELSPVLLIVALAIVCFYPERKQKRERAGRK